MAQSQKIIIGNWKMNPPNVVAAEAIFKQIQKEIDGTVNPKHTQTIICPPYVYLPVLDGLIKKMAGANGAAGAEKGKKEKKNKKGKQQSKNKPNNKYIPAIELGAQDLSPEPLGARTGEISGELLTQFHLNHVIIGHSERRDLGETDKMVNIKILAALDWKFKPILCIGEKVRDEDGHYFAFIRNQIEQALVGVKKESLGRLIIAYEPVWAIGATQAMTPTLVHEMVLFIRKTLVELYKIRAIPTPILYGGAVDPTNARAILEEGDAAGLLIGRQSLDPKAFSTIIKSAEAIYS